MFLEALCGGLGYLLVRSVWPWDWHDAEAEAELQAAAARLLVRSLQLAAREELLREAEARGLSPEAALQATLRPLLIEQATLRLQAVARGTLARRRVASLRAAAGAGGPPSESSELPCWSSDTEDYSEDGSLARPRARPRPALPLRALRVDPGSAVGRDAVRFAVARVGGGAGAEPVPERDVWHTLHQPGVAVFAAVRTTGTFQVCGGLIMLPCLGGLGWEVQAIGASEGSGGGRELSERAAAFATDHGARFLTLLPRADARGFWRQMRFRAVVPVLRARGHRLHGGCQPRQRHLEAARRAIGADCEARGIEVDAMLGLLEGVAGAVSPPMLRWLP